MINAKKIVLSATNRFVLVIQGNVLMQSLINKSIGNRENANDPKYVNKNLAYIVVVAEKETNNKIITRKTDTDSRKCYIRGGSFIKQKMSANCVSKPSTETIPAYLLVVQLTAEIMTLV